MKRIVLGVVIFVLLLLMPAAAAFGQIKIKTGNLAATQQIVTNQMLTNFANRLAEKMNGRSAGYAFTVIHNDFIMMSRVGGAARRAPDPNPRAMSANDKFNIASVSKMITAAALMKAAADSKVSLDDFAFKYLPSKWVVGPGFETITLRELLTHRSGIRCASEVTYKDLKTCVFGGIYLEKKAEQNYNNSNYALFRMIIPRILGFSDKAIADENQASKTYAKLYYDYVRMNIFEPAGLTGVELRPEAVNPALAYQHPGPIRAGTDFGDMFETSASRGWFMNTRQMATFINALLFRGSIIPQRMAKQMLTANLGFWPTVVDGKAVSFEHGGFYPGKDAKGEIWNDGEMNSLIITFPNGISVAVIVNSQFLSSDSVAETVRKAMAEVLAK